MSMSADHILYSAESDVGYPLAHAFSGTQVIPFDTTSEGHLGDRVIEDAGG